MPEDLPRRYDRPPLLWRPLHAIRAWVLVVVGLMIYGAISVYAGLRGRPLGLVARAYHGFSKVVLLAFEVKVQALELESSPESWPDRLVMVANHESNLDGPLLNLCLADRHVRYVVKHELTRVPILGAALLATGSIPVKRQVKGAGVRSLDRPIDPGVDVLFFAEGTRSKSGELQPFRKGAFHFARQQGWHILPIGIAGTGASLPPGSATPRPGPVAVVLGRPIPPHGSVESLRSQTEDEVARLRRRARVRAAEGLEPASSRPPEA